MQVRPYHLNEVQRSTLSRLLMVLCLGGNTKQALREIAADGDQSTALHQIMDMIREPIPQQPLWRTFSDDVQDAATLGYMECENIDKHRAHDELDQITDFDEAARYASDPALLAAVYNGDCCVDDFRGCDDPEDRGHPEYQHWHSWGCMKDLGFVTEEEPTERGIEHVLWDDESLLEGPHQVYYRTAGIGGEWLKARDAQFETWPEAKTHADNLRKFYAPQTEYTIRRAL